MREEDLNKIITGSLRDIFEFDVMGYVQTCWSISGIDHVVGTYKEIANGSKPEDNWIELTHLNNTTEQYNIKEDLEGVRTYKPSQIDSKLIFGIEKDVKALDLVSVLDKKGNWHTGYYDCGNDEIISMNHCQKLAHAAPESVEFKQKDLQAYKILNRFKPSKENNLDEMLVDMFAIPEPKGW